MTLAEAFDMLQALGPARAVDKWGPEGLKCVAVHQACSITLGGLMIDPPDDPAEIVEVMAQMIWLVAIAFEAGRISEGGTPV